ncbi:YeeE/YedE family protein [Defluviimonas sp. WL0002]|uniref:YeeE/YedE family protein n=1 Tax=Albidovulum marisflavi TaxID=2984159 RepID=A0ABT2ZFA5_9RHOB|nr:YeeE/YedE family protein [Defluviimonas sp. WL0002]MCV2869755.1 YeeE/YedE family protein [Defluviimonas sp. WL0002]
MFETLGFETLGPREVSVMFGLAIGVAFGALAEATRFCLRRGLVGPQDERRAALGLWLMALAVAVAGTQAAVWLGWIDFTDHRFMASDLPVLAILLGGLLFGAGMVLTRGCASRLTVLAGTGNLRALTVLLVFAIVAHATTKGVLSPLRELLGGYRVSMGEGISLSALPGGAIVWSAIIVALAAGYALRSGNRPAPLLGGAMIGALVPLAWVGTGLVLFDEFDAIAFESLSFTSPATEALFWSIASSSIPAGFGTGLIGGALAGAAALAVIAGRFRWQSFVSPRETGRYLAGAVLMGFGGVLAGGCTVGAGLAGVPTLSLAAVLALIAIAAGAVAANAVLRHRSAPRFQPAE